MIQIEKIAENLFDKIRSRFSGVSIGDKHAKATLSPENARFFNFDFSVHGNTYGNVTLSLIDEQRLKVYFDKEIDKGMTEKDEQAWFDFLKNLRLFAKRNMLSFDVRDISKIGLSIQDLKHATKDAEVITKDEIAVNESRLYGTSRSSYESIGNDVRIIARHKARIVDETKPGARSRNIQAFYIENSLGERFRCPEGTTFNGARAIARHVKNGGQMSDEFGNHIAKIISEMNSLKTFVRNTRGRTFEDLETNEMVQAAIDHYGKLHRDLFTIRSQRGYEQYRDLWQPEIDEDSEVDIDALRERFIKRVFDDRLTAALPIVYRAHKTRKDAISDEFESWASKLVDEESDNPVDQANKQSAANEKDIEESAVINLDDKEFDDSGESDLISKILADNNFEFQCHDGTYFLESHEEIERAKDIIAQIDAKISFPKFEVYPSTIAETISDIAKLAGLTK